MIGFFNCPSNCVYNGFFSWEGICPIVNLIILFTSLYIFTRITILIINKLKKKKND